jgi:HSP20 family molecular chaperone IbpA
MFPELVDWLESPFAVLRPFMTQSIRLEDYIEDGHYVVRAELPGIDPEKQLEVTVTKGVLTIHAERHEESEMKHRSEFAYGVFARHIPLPAGADEAEISATYDKGVLQVSVGLKDTQKVAGRTIPVSYPKKVKPAG